MTSNPPVPYAFWRFFSPNILNLLLLIVLFMISLSVGVADWSWAKLFAMEEQSSQLLIVSRLPRTFAIVLTGATLSVAGMILQILLRNRFIEPSMVGATQSAVLGLLVMVLLFPAATLLAKMSVAAVFALLGMKVFVQLLRILPKSQLMLVPVIGIIYGGIIDAFATFIAFETDTLQLLVVWTSGDFSGVLIGRYELLWVTAILAIISYLMADQLTIAGLGKHMATSLGINYQHVQRAGLVLVSLITALVVVTVGHIPFIGLVVPNIISRLSGDRLRKNLPAVALMGANLVLACDILSRVINFPYEIPVSTLFGIFGTLLFLYLLFWQPRKARQA